MLAFDEGTYVHDFKLEVGSDTSVLFVLSNNDVSVLILLLGLVRVIAFIRVVVLLSISLVVLVAVIFLLLILNLV